MTPYQKLQQDNLQRDLIRRINEIYKDHMLTAMETIANHLEDRVKKEAEDVYIARSFREQHHLPELRRNSEKNDYLPLSIKASPVSTHVDFDGKEKISFMISDVGRPKPSLFGGKQGGIGDLTKWTVGDSTYDGHGGVSGKSYIHPITDDGHKLWKDIWYDGDPFVERAWDESSRDVEYEIKEAMHNAISHAIKQTLKEFGL